MMGKKRQCRDGHGPTLKPQDKRKLGCGKDAPLYRVHGRSGAARGAGAAWILSAAEKANVPFARISAVRLLPCGRRGDRLFLRVVGAGGVPGKDVIGAVDVSRRSGAPVEP